LDRLLKEIPPPGRPKSQCLTCRAKRESEKAHHNCRCGPEPPSQFKDYLSIEFTNSANLKFEFPKSSLPVETLIALDAGISESQETQRQELLRDFGNLQEFFLKNSDLKVFLVRKAKDIQVPITLQVARLEMKRLPMTSEEIQKQSGKLYIF
jgi:hypothetical protein